MNETIDSRATAGLHDADVSSEEVDALLDSVGSSGGSAAPDLPKGVARPYDLVAREKIVRSRMPVLDRINERWVGEFQRNLSDLVRRPVDVSAAEVQLCSYGEWQARMPTPSSLNLYLTKPWGRNALVAVDGNLLFVLVEAYYGGGGQLRDGLVRERLTPTEYRFNQIVIDALTTQFRQAFEPIAALTFEHQKTEINPHYLSIATSTETVVVTRIEVALDEAGGSICLVFPSSAFDPVREKLNEGLKTVSAETRQRWHRTIRAQLEGTELELSSVFLEAELTVRELLQLKPGDILPIEMPKTATLAAGSKALLHGKFGISRGYNAIRIVEAVRDAWNGDGGDI
jgi:flagellar motor switch protein FliM